MTLRVITNAVCAGVLTVALATSAYALSQNVKNLNYIFHQGSNFSISYDIVRDAMKDTYRGNEDPNPLIGIAEVDLNGDKLPEIIGFPTEEEAETGAFCKQDGLCPHYVLQVREKSVRTLAVIYADSVDVGDDIKNGYWTLRAYKKEREGSNDFETYVFNKKNDGYVFDSKTTASPPKQNDAPRPNLKNNKKEN